MLPAVFAQVGAVAGLIGLFIGVLLYFLPFVVAVNRGHKNATAIFVLNLFLGWTMIGWVVALVWSFTKD